MKVLVDGGVRVGAQERLWGMRGRQQQRISRRVAQVRRDVVVWPYLGRNRRPLVRDIGIHLILQGVQVLHRTLEGNTLLSASLSLSRMSASLLSPAMLLAVYTRWDK